ncbi:MAG: choice-of-anchor D domain-containing protein [Deltaproteobacteria bacterium]|nr:choice-of-anchor D domain-containing protein [Deltaproteobacteria bacterium]
MGRSDAAILLLLFSALAPLGCGDDAVLMVARCGIDAECGPGEICDFEGACVPKDAVSCAAVPGGEAILQPGPVLVEFGQVGPATSFKTLTLRNIGNCTLTLFEASFAADEESPFVCGACAASRFPIELFPMRDTELEIAFTPPPGTVGEFRDTLQILSDDEEYNEIPVTVRARYDGVPNARAIPDALEFGYVPVGRTVQKTVQISNHGDGTAALVIKGLEIVPTGTTAFSFAPDFLEDISLVPVRLDTTAIHTVTVKYHPREIGKHAAELLVRTNMPRNGTIRVPLTGTSETPPKIAVSPEAIDFGPVPLGQSVAQIVTISNEGGSPLDVTYRFGGSAFTTDFSGLPALVPSVEPGQYTEIQVLVTATAPGSIGGLLILESNDPNRPSITIPISATGQDVVGQQVVKIDMTWENGDDSAFDDDLRDIDLTLENPFGLICNKQFPNPTNWGAFGTPSWVSFGVVGEPERVVLPNAQQDGIYRALLTYNEDCSFIPSGLLAAVLGISVDILINALLGGSIGIGGDDVSNAIDDVCFDHDASSATLTVFINGTIIAEKTIRMANKGDTVYALDLVRSGGVFTVR